MTPGFYALFNLNHLRNVILLKAEQTTLIVPPGSTLDTHSSTPPQRSHNLKILIKVKIFRQFHDKNSERKNRKSNSLAFSKRHFNTAWKQKYNNYYNLKEIYCVTVPLKELRRASGRCNSWKNSEDSYT